MKDLYSVWGDVRCWSTARWYFRKADTLGTRVRLAGRPKIRNRGVMVVGDRVRVDSVLARVELVASPGGRLEIGDRVFINVGCSIAATELVQIGAGSLLGPHCMLIDNAFHHVEPELRLTPPPSSPIILEENVWLSARTIVLPGVRIGANSCVAAGSVVTRDVEPRTLVGGVPAKLIRRL